MSTGVSSFANLSELSTLYPFAGMEYVFTGVLLAFLVIFFLVQTALEQIQISKIVGAQKSTPAAESSPASALSSPAE